MTEEINIQDEHQELYEHFNIIADKRQSSVRIDKYLMSRIENASRNKIQQSAKAGNILVNDKPVKSNYKVRPGDQISIVMTYPPREVKIVPEDISFDIVYEDDDVLVINKVAGMVVHPAFGDYTGTLVNALTWYFQHQLTSEVDAKPFLAHRIDKNTSGTLLVAKNEVAQAKLAKQFYDHTTDRKYMALVWGDLKEDDGTITGHIGRNPKDRKTMTVFPDGDHGKHAITHYKVKERFGYITLVECILETGRTHQIRAHFKYIGHPLFNDSDYGGDQILKGTTFSKYKQFILNCFKILPRQALHAQSIGFIHPSTNKPLHFSSDLPDDIRQVIEKWRGYVEQRKME